ncbi:MAG: Holliday junction resolvase RuvX, partial [Gammaproteobacteria bacterium]|nr:Holliday junction resolvase RuvX [Gammaproteobacteria bacterium]
MAFDFGTRHIGVAIGQFVTRTANPLTTLSATNGAPDWDQLSNL